MKTTSVILAVCMLCGCASYKAAVYSPVEKAESEHQGLKIGMTLRPHERDLHIPFVIWWTREGPPYQLDLTLTSRAPVGEAVEIMALSMTMPDGSARNVLAGKRLVLPFEQKEDQNSRSRSGDPSVAHRAFWSSDLLPITFSQDSTLSVHLEYRIGERTGSVTRKFKAVRKKELEGILTTYSNI